MVTKWKRFTARTLVKLCCFLLIIVLCFIALNRLYACGYRANTERVSPEIVFSDLTDYSVFYSNHMNSAYYYAAQLARYKDESSIHAGEHIKWELQTNEYWHNDEVTIENEYRLFDSANGYTFTTIDESAYRDAALRDEAEQNLIRHQLSDFRRTRDVLEGKYGDMYNTEGMLYCVKGGGFSYFNVSPGNDNEEYFKSKPVYIVTGELGLTETSHNFSYPYDYLRSLDTGVAVDSAVVYVAFDREVVESANAEYRIIKSLYTRDFTILAVSGVLILAALIILLAGAGRRLYDNGESVRFTVFDKPYLDLGLVAAGLWIGMIIAFAIELAEGFINYNNTNAMNLIFAGASIKIISPALWWLTSLAKRIKTGGFLRHTLIYAVLSGIARFIKSLWAGFPLTAKVLLICLGAFGCMLIMTFAGATLNYGGEFFVALLLILLTAVIAFLLLRYARRIHKLELGALDASRGGYDKRIDVGRGELGRIADSINNISAGINTAVEERMKSERLKTELITNVSHDIRTPLTSIITYTDLLKHEGMDCEKAPEYLDVLIQKSQRLKTLTDELFEASKAATGNIDVNLTELDLTALIRQVLGELDGSVKASGLDLRVKLPERAFVRADGKLMWRVLENLLSNVFKYSLKNSRVYLTAERENHDIRIDIKNISATELNVEPSELTERFKRGDEARADGGSGLGLSIVQSFLDAQGGRMALSIDGDLFKASVYLPSV